jgi:hypothetical protein
VKAKTSTNGTHRCLSVVNGRGSIAPHVVRQCFRHLSGRACFSKPERAKEKKRQEKETCYGCRKIVGMLGELDVAGDE